MINHSPNEHFDRWYGHHSQSWVVYDIVLRCFARIAWENKSITASQDVPHPSSPRHSFGSNGDGPLCGGCLLWCLKAFKDLPGCHHKGSCAMQPPRKAKRCPCASGKPWLNPMISHHFSLPSHISWISPSPQLLHAPSCAAPRRPSSPCWSRWVALAALVVVQAPAIFVHLVVGEKKTETYQLGWCNSQDMGMFQTTNQFQIIVSRYVQLQKGCFGSALLKDSQGICCMQSIRQRLQQCMYIYLAWCKIMQHGNLKTVRQT